MLKFENTANIGDTIKAFNFKPVDHPNYPDSFLIGEVLDKGKVDGGYSAYTVKVTGGTNNNRIGNVINVPFEVAPHDFDERVSLYNV